MGIYIFNNTNSDIRVQSSAGGLFSALAETIISQGGSVYGATFDNDWRICHSRIDNITNLDTLRRSKYAFTDISTCFSKLFNDISTNKPILVVGTPCQIAIVRNKFGEVANMLLVEVVCHGAPHPKYWDLYLDELLQSKGKTRDDIESINFRDKSEGWKNYSVRVDFKDGSRFIQNHRDNLYILAFVYDYTLRAGCAKCPFKHPNSKADILMGDFWGIEALTPELDNNLGTTLAIANTTKGKRILESMATPTSLSIDEVAKHNPAIVKAPNTPLNKPEFDQLIENKSFHFAANSILRPLLIKNQTSIQNKFKSLLYSIFTKTKDLLTISSKREI